MLFRPFFFSLQSEIKIISTTVFVDPYEEADAQVCISVSVCIHKQHRFNDNTQNAPRLFLIYSYSSKLEVICAECSIS